MADQARLQARVSGDVQGVGFRFFVVRRAGELGLRGWVANRPDGSVETVAEGPRPQLERLVEALRQGPPGAEVDGVDVSWQQPKGDLSGFIIAG